MMREHKNPIKMNDLFKFLINTAQKRVNDLGVDVKVGVDRDDETGRIYLTGTFIQRLKFKGMDELFVNETTLTEEIYRGDQEMALKLFMGYFSPNRVAHMKATDEQLMAYEGHPDKFPIA